MNNKQKDVCITVKGVSASKLKANCCVDIINTNHFRVNVLYRIFGLRNDGTKHDLLASDTIILEKNDSRTSMIEVNIGYDSVVEFNEIYYTVIVDIIHKPLT